MAERMPVGDRQAPIDVPTREHDRGFPRIVAGCHPTRRLVTAHSVRRGSSQAPERWGAVALDLGAADAEIAKHSVVEARETLPVAVGLMPRHDPFDPSGRHASEKGVKAGGTLRAWRCRRGEERAAV